MSHIVKLLVEEYLSSSQQYEETMKNVNASQKKYDKEKEIRNQFIISLLGKPMYNKLVKHSSMGTFAPIMLSAIKLNAEDFQKVFALNKKDNPMENVQAVAECMRKAYARNDFRFYDDGTLLTDIVFSSMDNIIDFFNSIIRCFMKVSKVPVKQMNTFNVKPVIMKFKQYLN